MSEFYQIGRSHWEQTAGFLTTVFAHGILLVGYLLMQWAQAAGLLSAAAAPPIDERVVVEARIMRLGKELDPSQLPNRIVPIRHTAPDDAIAVSANPEENTPEEEKERPPDPEEDLLTRLGDRAQAFAEIAEQQEREGSPDGIEDGSDTNQAGDIYAGKLYAFFRGWTVPTTISPEQLKSLTAEVDVEIRNDLTLGRFAMRKSSGNPTFDQAVIAHLETIRLSGKLLPEPPPEVASDYLGRSVGLRFRGKDAKQ